MNFIVDSMEFHGFHGIPWNPWSSMGQARKKVKKTIWLGRAGPDWPRELHRALRPVRPARAGLGSLNLCKLNGGSTAEVKESG